MIPAPMALHFDTEWLRRKLDEMDAAGVDDSRCLAGGTTLEQLMETYNDQARTN